MKINCFAGLFQPPNKFSNIFGKISKNLFARAVLVKLRQSSFLSATWSPHSQFWVNVDVTASLRRYPVTRQGSQGQVERPAVTDTFPVPIPSSSMPSSNYDNISNKALKYS